MPEVITGVGLVIVTLSIVAIKVMLKVVSWFSLDTSKEIKDIEQVSKQYFTKGK